MFGQQDTPSLEALTKDPVLFLQTAAKALKWEAAAEPFKIAGPLYFVGTKGLGAFLMPTTAGHSVVNTGMPGSGPMIEASIRPLGFDPQAIQRLLIGHAHRDHAGGHAYLTQLSGAKIAVIREEVDLFASGGQRDFHYGPYKEYAFALAQVDLVCKDDDVLRLGESAITALRTPGHTKGSTSFVTDVVDGGTLYKVAFPTGTTVNPGYRLVVHPSSPGIADDFRRTLHGLARLKPDIWVGLHTDWGAPEGKQARARTAGVKAFVDPEGYRRWVAGEREKCEAAVHKELGVTSKTQ